MLNVGNNPLKFRKAELERKPALIFGRINNLECHTSPKHSLSTFAACSAIGTLRHLSRVGDHLVVVENTPQRHNMVVCTLLSGWARLS
jgi:hypothetical protein